MRSTITVRGQTVFPAPIRERFSLSPSQRWSLMSVLLLLDTSALLTLLHRDPEFRGVADLAQEWLG
jgi:hypothetical protein